ncbi:MAG TPA: protease modulator HflK [Verrucomicrobiae bacterium]|nr:protease modulator HflK [Verrucomicrobiae bacterium]
MERTAQKHGVINLVALLAVGLGAFAVARACQSQAGLVTSLFFGLGVLVSAVSWFQMRLEDRERLEKLEFDEVTKGAAGSSTLFNTGEAEAFQARRSREQFEKYFVPGFTMLLLLLEAGACWGLWRWLGSLPAGAEIKNPLVAMPILGLMTLVLFLLGQYASGLARLQGQRLLNPGASALLLGSYLLALNVAAIAATYFERPAVDLFLARALCVLLGVLAVENLLSLLLEIYRPRVKGRAARLLYESRLVTLLSHPEGVFTTVERTLDYQFGFKVSETWFYQFLRRSAVALGMAYFAILALSTCMVYVRPGEQALLERWGRPVPGREILSPGFHVKWFWPVDRVHRYRTHEIQTFNVGFEHEEQEGEQKEPEVVLWTVSHVKNEFHLLVASRERVDDRSTNASRAPPVNLLSVGVPVQFQITNLHYWAYNYADAGTLLKEIATREVSRYLVGVDVNEIMSTARFTAGEELRRRIQARADELKLGAKVLFVGLQDVHPPVQVGAAYEKVMAARQQREANIRKARAYATRTNALASSDATRRRLNAAAQSTNKVAVAMATESLFTNQVTAYHASPDVYSQRAYLQAMARGGSGARKFIVLGTNSQILQLNLEDKIRADDLLNQPLPTPKPK